MPVKACKEKIDIVPLCKCGCGNKVKWDKYNERWNIYLHGHALKGRKHTEESKKKISASKIGHNTSDVTKMKISQKLKGRLSPWNKGKSLSEETKEKLRQANLGKVTSEETKMKLSIRLKGRIVSEETRDKMSRGNKGQSPWNKGKKLSIAHRQKISKAHVGKELTSAQREALLSWQKDENRKKIVSKKISNTLIEKNKDIEERIKMSCNLQGISREEWTHFVSCDPYCQDWIYEFKEMIKERDKYECRGIDCRGNTTRLVVHHIDYNKKNCDLNNLITLCNSCNSRANGSRNDNRLIYERVVNASAYRE